MNRALAALTVAALVALVIGAPDAQAPVASVLLGLAFAVLATAGFAWVRRQSRPIAGGYVGVQLVLGNAVFSTSDASIGAVLLLIVLVMQAVLLLPLPWAIGAASVIPFFHVGMSPREGLREGLGTLAAIGFAVFVAELLARERRTREELAVANDRLRAYADQAEQLATTQERNRVARDIHDGLGHHLTVVRMQLQAARAVLGAGETDRAGELLDKAGEQAREALEEVRRSVGALREPRTVPLPDAVRSLAGSVVVTGTVRAVPPAVEEALYRVAQEGLTNVRKHAKASAASVTLAYEPDRVRVEIRDDGVGPGEGEGFGLVGLKERLAAVGGAVSLSPAADGGAVLRAEVPA